MNIAVISYKYKYFYFYIILTHTKRSCLLVKAISSCINLFSLTSFFLHQAYKYIRTFFSKEVI